MRPNRRANDRNRAALGQRRSAGVPPPEGLLPERDFRWLHETRRHPRLTQPDYLHIRYLVKDLRTALARLASEPIKDVLDIYCGTRPYEDLLPPGARCVGLDVEGNPYGVADVISNEFLPFADESFDLVLCIESFHYVSNPTDGVAEIFRVLRPGGAAVVAVPLVWEYNRTILEHRYTGPELAAHFGQWSDVRVVENGGLAVSWATLSGWIVTIAELHARRRLGFGVSNRPVLGLPYVAINAVGLLADWVERRVDRSPYTLPMNLLLTARRPRSDVHSA